MEYTYLDTEQQRTMLEARLRQLEQEHYGHAMNAKNADPNDEETIKASEEAMTIIDRAYGAAKMELAALMPDAPKPKGVAK